MKTDSLPFRIIFLVFVLYLAVGLYIQAVTGNDYLPPCIWYTIFGFRCPGCGLTTALLQVLRFDFIEAWNTNWKIFIVLPMFLMVGLKSILKSLIKIITSK